MVLKHKPPAHTQKLCVIKQLHNTQRVSMTTRKLIGKLQKKLPLYPCLSQPCALLEQRSKLTFGTKQFTSGRLLEERSSSPWASQAPLSSKPTPHFGFGPAKHQITECSKPTPHFGAGGHEAGDEQPARSQPPCCPPPRESLMPSRPPYKYSPCQLIDPKIRTAPFWV